jgi:GMP synthase-like glutamine amidotransferase
VGVRGLILQHGEYGPPGVLGQWARERGLAFDVAEMWRDGVRPDPAGYGWVASLGAEQSVNDGAEWVRRELEVLGEAVERDVPVLGLCFGGQALAAVLGGEVGPAPGPEIGWLPVDTAAPELVPRGPWLEWHVEAFTVPPGAEPLAERPSGPQAFRAGRHLGVQFHPEATADIAAQWSRMEDPERLDRLGLTPEALARQSEQHAAAAASRARRLFDAWYARAAAPAR